MCLGDKKSADIEFIWGTQLFPSHYLHHTKFLYSGGEQNRTFVQCPVGYIWSHSIRACVGK